MAETPQVWETDAVKEWDVPLETPGPDAGVLSFPIRSSIASQLFVELGLRCGAQGTVYRTDIAIEWQGERTLSLRLDDFKSQTIENLNILEFDRRKGPCSAALLQGGPVTLILRAKDFTFPGTRLGIGAPAWLPCLPPVPIHEGEAILEDLTSARFWDLDEWKVASDPGMPENERGTEKIWFFMQPWYVERAGRTSSISVRKAFRQDIGGYQALIASVSFDADARISASVVVDGVERTPVRDAPCVATAMELRIPLEGRVLESLRLTLRSEASGSGDPGGVRKVALLRWILLEKKGFDHRAANLVTGMPRIADPARVEPYETAGLPVGILFDREELAALRRKTESGGGARLLRDILREVESHRDHSPEDQVGFFPPVDMWNQGIERDNSPKTHHRNVSLMVNGGLAYALTGDLRHGLAARRALLATIACTHWCGGFVSRIPEGLPGYRAPFVESHAAEAVSLCYDMIHNLLSAEERRAVEDALFTKAIPWIDAYLRRNGEGEGYLLRSNQGPVYSAGFILAALVASRSHPEVLPLLEKRIDWLLAMIRGYYDEEGSTLEGPSYWQYTTHYTILPLLAIARHRGVDVRDLAPPWFEKTVEYMQHMRSLADPRLKFQSIADCMERMEMFSSGPSFLFFSKYYGNRGAFWVWRKYLDREFKPGDPFFTNPVAGNFSTVPLLTLLLMEDGEAEPPRLPDGRLYGKCQRIFVRTGADAGDKLLVFEGGAQTFEHTHWDKGEFLIEAFGEKLIFDPGIIQYGNPHAVLFKTTGYHNLLTVGRRNQSYKDPAHAVVLREFRGESAFHWIRADLSNCYKELHAYERSILFVRPDWFLVVDTVSSAEDGLEWNLHSKGVFLKEGDGAFLIQAPRAGMRMAFASDAALAEGFAVHEDEEGPVAHKLFLAPGKGVREFVLAAVLVPFPNGNGRSVPEILVEGRDASAMRFRVKTEAGVDSLLCRFRPNPDPSAGGKTLAAVEVARLGRNGAVKRFRIGGQGG